MSSVPIPKRRSFLRFWLPRVIIALAALDAALIWLLPSEEFFRAQRIFATVAMVVVCWLLLSLWVLLFSGYTWQRRLAVVFLPLVGVVAGGFTVIRGVHFDGGMAPILQYRWTPTQEEHDASLEANRHGQARASDIAPTIPIAATPNDFPGYRGRDRDGIVKDLFLERDWKNHAPELLWKQPVGGGYAAFAIAGNIAITIEQRRDQEAVVCYDATSGHERWAYSYPAFFKEPLGGDGPRATPTLADGDVYSFGATGMLVCLDAATGRHKWSVNVLEDNDNIWWGMSGSPLVCDQLVIVNPGTQRASASGRAVVAFDRATGKEVWRAGATKAAYSSPMLASLAGRRQILIFDAEGLHGLDSADGHELWHFEWKSYQDINVAQPVVLGDDRVFISSGYNHGCAMLRIAETGGQWSAQPIWPEMPSRSMHCKFSSPVLLNGYLYGIDEGRIVCVDVASGKQKWKDGHFGHGQMLLVGDVLLVLSESGKLVLIDATPTGSHELASIPALQGEKTWNYPAVAGDRAYLRNSVEMACYKLPVRETAGDKLPQAR
jgi:outer membrane protein assembly factor BamB